MVNCRALLLAATASGQGKTTLTAALARKFANEGKKVRVFKTGPDFLDPMLLERACGTPVHTLDLWIVGIDACQRLLAEAARDADVILIEGVMGLYDGKPSAADLAQAFGVPVAIVLDAGAMAQTAGAVVMGLRDYGPARIAGVIANRIGSAGHAEMVKTSLRDIPLLGYLPKQDTALPERHLGLLPANEIEGIDALIETLAGQVVLEEDAWNALPSVSFTSPSAPRIPRLLEGKTIAVAHDAAFAFLYPANLDCLRELGACITFFSPLADDPVPSCADAVYLPGGYPELHAEALATAARWRESIRHAHASGVPIWAECGGMMAVCESLTDLDGKSWDMPGLLPGAVHMQKRLAGLGSQGLATAFGPWRGHTFHYSRLETAHAESIRATKHPSGAAGEAFYECGSLLASYFHAYFPSCIEATAAVFSGRALFGDAA